MNKGTKPVCIIRKGMTYTDTQLAYKVSRALEKEGYVMQSKEFRNRFFNCKNQKEGWDIIGEYVKIEKR